MCVERIEGKFFFRYPSRCVSINISEKALRVLHKFATVSTGRHKLGICLTLETFLKDISSCCDYRYSSTVIFIFCHLLPIFFYRNRLSFAQGEYWDGRAGVEECKLCSDVGLNPDGVECYEQGTLLETLPLARGFWRSIPTTTVS